MKIQNRIADECWKECRGSDLSFQDPMQKETLSLCCQKRVHHCCCWFLCPAAAHDDDAVDAVAVAVVALLLPALREDAVQPTTLVATMISDPKWHWPSQNDASQRRWQLTNVAAT